MGLDQQHSRFLESLYGLVLQATGYTTTWILCSSIALLSATTVLLGRYLLLGDQARTAEKQRTSIP